MICLHTVKRFCKEYWKIENYQEAVNDTTQTWHCHHRYEIEYNLSKIELQALGFYFNRSFDELIFMTPEEHFKLHNIGKVGPWRGKHRTEETKQKIREAKLGKYEGENNPMYGKISPMRGKHHTEETREKMSTARKGKDKYHITADELYDLYVVRGLSTCKIAEIYGCGSECIRLKIKKYNIKK